MNVKKILNMVISNIEQKDYVLASDLLDYVLAAGEKTIEDYIKEGWLVQRMNDESGKKEWCLVDHKGKKTKEGEKRNLKWYGSKKPNAKEIKERIAEVKYFKSKE